MSLTPADQSVLRRMIADYRRYGIKKRTVPPLTVTEGPDGQVIGLGELPAASSGVTWVVPLAKIVTDLPADCDELGETVPQCYGPYYYARIVEWDEACGAWADGACVFLTEVHGRGLVAGVLEDGEVAEVYPAWLLGEPSADLIGVPVPPDFPCDDFSTAPLYGCSVGDVGRVIEVTAEIEDHCGEVDNAYVRAYAGTALVWADCDGWQTVEENVILLSVNGCELVPGLYPGGFERMAPGDEFDPAGDPRECLPVYSFRREKNQRIRLACEGGRLKVYGPSADPFDFCGDDEELLYEAGCCGCDGDDGGGGGGGGLASCCSRPLDATLYVTVPGNGVTAITWNPGFGRWEGGALLPCGETLYLRFSTTCQLSYSCDGVSFVGAPVSGSDTCGPPYLSGDWLLNMDDGAAGCIAGKCGTISGVVVREAP